MPTHRLTDVVRRAAGVAGRLATAPDRDLLASFVADHDADAFAELVRRHGAMVRGVCRRALGNTPEVDDACQATFLVLARKAAAVRRADAVGSWLYGVARRVAWRARQRRQASRERERPESNLPPVADVPGSPDLADLLAVLDEELTRLPDTYRAPLVLCYLEGRTQDEAARQLGWSLGAFRGRLERGRARLRARLDRRGVGLAVLAAVAAADTAAGAVPADISNTIVLTATAVSAGQTVTVPAGVAALSSEIMRAMTMSKLQWAAGVVAVCGLLTAGGVWATGQGPGIGANGQPPGGAPEQPGQPRQPLTAEANREPPAERQASTAQRHKSQNNLRQLMIAVHNYHDANNHLPADIRGQDGTPLLSWRVLLLPYLEQHNLYTQFKLDEPWDSEHNLKLLARMPAVYRVGIEPKDSTHTYFQVFAGPNTPLHPMPSRPGRAFPGGGGAGPGGPLPAPGGVARPRGAAATDDSVIRFMQITDGTSNTLGVVEASPPVPWTKPADIPFDPKKPVKLDGPFANEFHATTMDGAAWALKRDLDPDVLRRLIVMNDGELVPPLNELQARRPVESPADKAQLKSRMDKSRHVIDQIHRLMQDYADLVAQGNDLDAAEDLAAELQRMEEGFEAAIRKAKEKQPPKP